MVAWRSRLVFFCFILLNPPMGGYTKGKGRVYPWMSRALGRFSTLLKVTWATLWRCSGISPYYQNPSMFSLPWGSKQEPSASQRSFQQTELPLHHLHVDDHYKKKNSLPFFYSKRITIRISDVVVSYFAIKSRTLKYNWMAFINLNFIFRA